MPPSMAWFGAATAWMRFAADYSQMALAASEVILRRTMLMQRGMMTGPEAVGMVMEKGTAFAVSAERAAVAAAAGADPAHIARAALRPYHTKARSNVRKYRR